ncbi:hypothetical protein [Legionella cincinnatiensis]|uniref:Uncharacterized protein n=1 Tax=Legionella cincinnatiensis TaxID=28085 RepID=A0A378IIU2_9GAMM|nr:hypothetical protein [Legionella cincinnatiensis]KTC93210.1 hypothetical protein Lcin_0248 [Legionella cincinnatiensis]STX35089.1 Uncharacterised protein [Legionella cincinnatiensis]
MAFTYNDMRKFNKHFDGDSRNTLSSEFLAQYIANQIFNIMGNNVLANHPVVSKQSGIFAKFFNIISNNEKPILKKQSGCLLMKILSVYDEIRQRKDEEIAHEIILKNIGGSLPMLSDLIKKLEITLTEESKGLLETIQKAYNTRAQGICLSYATNHLFTSDENIKHKIQVSKTDRNIKYSVQDIKEDLQLLPVGSSENRLYKGTI